MMKFIKIIICMLLIPIIGVSAAELFEIKLIDNENGIFQISGSLSEGHNNRIATFIMTSEEVSAEAAYNGKKIVHQGGIEVGYDGSFSYSFKFSGDSGKYVIYLIENGRVLEKEIGYSDYSDLLQLVSDIAGNQISGAALVAALREHSLALDIDISALTSSDDVNVIIKRISGASITAPSDIAPIITKAKREIKLTEDIHSATVWNQIYTLLDQTKDITNISLAGYNSLSDINKKNVSLALMGKKFKDGDEVKTIFEKAVVDYSNVTPPPSGGGGVGGGVVPQRPYSGGLIDVLPVPVEPLPTTAFFTDIENAGWASQAILFLAERQIIAGDGNKNFMPNDFVKREEAAKMIVLASKYYNEFAVSDFSDVSGDDWSFAYISSAYENDILKGISETEFGYGSYVTREDLAVLLYRTLIKKGITLSNKGAEFTDYEDISEYARDAVLYLAGDNIINGMDDFSFSPKSYATRAQTAKLIYEALGGIYDGEK